MLILHATTDIIRVVTGSAADVEPAVSVMETDNATPPVVQDIPNLGPLASITTATTTTIVDCTTANRRRNVKHISLYNNHASQATTCRVEFSDGTLVSVLANVNLLAGEMLVLTQGGVWLHYDSNGGLYPSVGNAASRAEMEAGTATDKYVTPQDMNWHPGVCKAWGKHAVSGAVPQMTATWNVTSVTDSGVSRVTPVIATDFSSANYSISANAEAATTTYSATTTCLICVIRNATPSVTQFTLDLLEIDIGQATDPAAWYWQAFGDQ
jgi:hypothetical protein